MMSISVFAIDNMIIPARWGYTADSATYVLYVEDSVATDSGLICTSCTGAPNDTIHLSVDSNRFINYYIYIWQTIGGIDRKASWAFQKMPSDTTDMNVTSASAGHKIWTDNDGVITLGQNTPKTDSIYGYHINFIVDNTNSYDLTIDINYPGESIKDWPWKRDLFALGGATPTIPSDSNLCNVNGYVYDVSYNIVRYADVIFEIDYMVDTCSNVIIPKTEYKTKTNENGYFTKNLLVTDCMKDAKVWICYVEYTDKSGNFIMSRKKSFELPTDSTTYRLVF